MQPEQRELSWIWRNRGRSRRRRGCIHSRGCGAIPVTCRNCSVTAATGSSTAAWPYGRSRRRQPASGRSAIAPQAREPQPQHGREASVTAAAVRTRLQAQTQPLPGQPRPQLLYVAAAAATITRSAAQAPAVAGAVAPTVTMAPIGRGCECSHCQNRRQLSPPPVWRVGLREPRVGLGEPRSRSSRHSRPVACSAQHWPQHQGRATNEAASEPQAELPGGRGCKYSPCRNRRQMSQPRAGPREPRSRSPRRNRPVECSAQQWPQH